MIAISPLSPLTMTINFIAQREAKSFEREIGKYGESSFALERAIDMALNCKIVEVSARAQRWALEIVHVQLWSD